MRDLIKKKEIHIERRMTLLKQRAAVRYDTKYESCHIGHVVLEALLERPQAIHQIDGVTGEHESNLSVAKRSMRVASAMHNSGLEVGDHVVLMGHNHLDLCIPYFASHYNGYSLCAIDPSITLVDLTSLFEYINPRIVFAPKARQEDIAQALGTNEKEARIVTFDEKDNDLDSFVHNHSGTEVDFAPAIFDQKKTISLLMLTSGTTGLPKVAIIPYATLLNSICCWWYQFTDRWQTLLAMATIQWMSSLLFFLSTPIMKSTRVQSSVPITPQLLVGMINKYRPNVTAWTPYLLGQFLQAAGNIVDLSCFKYIAIGGSAIEKPLHDKFQEKCPAYLYLVYGMTELLVPVFEFNKDTPFGSTGKAYKKYQYKLVGENGEIVSEPNQTGELWIKGDAFFKGYLNNPEETDKIITKDGWIQTGDIFYKSEEGYYFYVERKRLLIKYTGFWISPLQLESVIRKHPGVAEVCVVGIPHKQTTETPVAVIVKRAGHEVEPREVFDLVKNEMPEIKQVHGGMFFLDQFPETPSGKIHRAKLRDIAITADKIFPKSV